MKYFECLPSDAGKFISQLADVREVRLRNGKPIRLNVGGKWFWLGKNCLQTSCLGALNFQSVCDEFVKKACNQSVYAYEKMLAQGFFTMSDGCRVGVCGVMGANGVFQQYTSVCVRTAKYHSCVDVALNNSFIVAGPPRSGKTTFLRDFACKTSTFCNVVVVDERGELSCCEGFDKKSFCDVFRYTDKKYAFQVAVRTMSPDWIVCDELSQGEISLLENAVTCGVKVAASLHASGVEEVRQKLGQAVNVFNNVVLLKQDTFIQTVQNLTKASKQLTNLA